MTHTIAALSTAHVNRRSSTNTERNLSCRQISISLELHGYCIGRFLRITCSCSASKPRVRQSICSCYGHTGRFVFATPFVILSALASLIFVQWLQAKTSDWPVFFHLILRSMPADNWSPFWEKCITRAMNLAANPQWIAILSSMGSGKTQAAILPHIATAIRLQGKE